jgi:hypothetical protein
MAGHQRVLQVVVIALPDRFRVFKPESLAAT